MPKSSKAPSSERQEVFQNQFTKTVICRFYLANACKKGNNCTFAHTIEELNEVPDLTKTALCKNFKRGICKLPADQCPYAHSRRELRMSPAFKQMVAKKRSGTASSADCDDSTPSTSAGTDASEGSQSSVSPPMSPRRTQAAAKSRSWESLPWSPGSSAQEEALCADAWPGAAVPEPPSCPDWTLKGETATGGFAAQPWEAPQPQLQPKPQQQQPQPQQQPQRPTLPSVAVGAAAAPEAKEPLFEPAFVDLRGLPRSSDGLAALDGLLNTSEKLLLRSRASEGPRPAYVNVPPPPPPGLSRMPEQAEFGQWWPQPPPPPPAAPAAAAAVAARAEAARQAAEAARQASELRAIASEAEKRAAAFAQEAVLLKLRAEAAERALAANMPSRAPPGQQRPAYPQRTAYPQRAPAGRAGPQRGGYAAR